MSAKVGYSTPLLHVAEIERSIRFYELLGFATVDTDRAKPLGWARLSLCEKRNEQQEAKELAVHFTSFEGVRPYAKNRPILVVRWPS